MLILRFDAPLMSFGGPAVDYRGVTEEFPSWSMLAGLLANALGYDHRDTDRTQRLQERVSFAARRDRAGTHLDDYQTVNLGQPHLIDAGWTTWGRPERRAGAFSKDTSIRLRSYLADTVYTVAMLLEPEAEDPTLGDVEAALRQPVRPLFLGRKPCLPARPICAGRVAAPGLRQALSNVPRIGDRGDPGPLSAWWPDRDNDDDSQSRLVPVTDERDWANQIHVGRRFLRHGTVNPPEV